MTGWIVNAAYAISGAMLVMMSISIAFSAFMPALDRWSRGYFITFFSVLLYAGIITIDMMIYENPEMASLLRVIAISEYLCFSVLTIMPMPLLLHCCGEKQLDSVPLRAQIMTWCVFCIMLLATQLCDMFYYVSSDNQYYRGPLFPLMISPLPVIMIINTAALIIKRKKISKRFFLALLIYILPTTIFIILYMFFDGVDLVISFWMFLCALTMFALILTDNMKKYIQQQQKIAHQHAEIMVLQMRPHFICNTMMGIYYLCDQDVQKAKQVTLDFTTYLRKNFAAIASENNIRFTEELEHTRAYLAVEQAQFENELFVNFDTAYSEFRLPPLTLQPIVENAVKHGLVASSNPIHISVTTRKTDTGSEIIVEDDGPGFKPADDNEPHIALKNIQERLEMMCKGKLDITVRKGGGTSVKVMIPNPDR